jgi:type VII secretion integral membrane protein EccD
VTDYTRVTIVGSTRRATLVVPNDEAVGALIPHLMELLGEKTATVARPLALVRLTGEQLDVTQSAADQAIADGELLHLLRLDEAPPPPEVSDVTDAVSETLGDRGGLWSSRFRMATAATAIGVLSLAAAQVCLAATTPWLAALPAAFWLFCVLAGLASGLARLAWPATAFLGAALGLSLPTAEIVAVAMRGTAAFGFTVLDANAVSFTICLLLIAMWIALGLVAGVGRGIRPALLAAAVGTLGGVLGAVLLLLGVPVTQASAVIATLAVIGCGLIPWYAMSASGLTGLDDQVMTGRLARRSDVLSTVGDAYRTLTWSTFAVAGVLTVSLIGLVISNNLWAVGLGGAIVVITSLRTRAFPLAAQVIALWAATLIAVLVGVLWQLGNAPAIAATVFGLLALVVAIIAGMRPARHQRASLRRAGNVIESLAVIALIPLLIGTFDVYSQLLGAF